MDRQCADPLQFGDLGYANAITRFFVPTGTDFKRHRYIHGCHHGVNYIGNKRLVPQQG